MFPRSSGSCVDVLFDLYVCSKQRFPSHLRRRLSNWPWLMSCVLGPEAWYRRNGRLRVMELGVGVAVANSVIEYDDSG